MRKGIRTVLMSLFVVSAFTYCTTKQEPITPSTALQRYLHNGDKTYHWETKETYEMNDGVKAYNLLLTSQQWRQYTWVHQLTVIVPKENNYDATLLFITGGHVKNNEPGWSGKDDELLQSMAKIAEENHAITAIIRQVPNQPLYDTLVEDQLISYTLHNFKTDKDYSWPLLFPMVKTAVRAMDAVQEFSKKSLKHQVDKFVISGASKRGWTTWLTGASDPRVEAIAPMVIDVLNMPVSLDYQIKVWKAYSPQIEDYVKLEIPQQVHTPEGDAITTMVDPYSYRKKLTMPKMIFIGTNDEYWPVDAIKNYIDSIPGQNYIHYVPNAGHGLGDKKDALKALSAFYNYTLLKKDYPECQYKISVDGKQITLSANASKDELLDAILWSADSEDRDFRDEEWSGKNLGTKDQSMVTAEETLPDSGYKAFYLDLKYSAPNGEEYTESTRMYVADSTEVLVK